MTPIKRFIGFYRELSLESLGDLDQLYANDITFIDPVERIVGLDSFKHYFAHLLETTDRCTCEVTETISEIDGDRGYASFTWVMTIEHPKLNKGQAITLEGASVVRFEQNKIVYHRDYYDLGEMVYERVPLLGSIIKWIKRRMQV